MKKIIHICQYLKHGSGKGTIQIIKMLHRMKLTQELILPEPFQGLDHGKVELDEVFKLGLRIHWVHSTFLREHWTAQALKACVTRIIDSKSVCFMTHGGFSASVLHSMGFNYTHYCHGFGLTRPDWVNHQDAVGISNAYRVLVASRDIAQQCEKLKVPRDKIRLHYYPLDLQLRKIRTNYFEHAIRVGQVGNFISQKGHVYSLKVLQNLLTFNTIRKKGITLNYFGMGPLENEIKSQVAEMGLNDQVIFHGHCSQDQIFESIDVMLLPSLVEGLGMVNVEAIEYAVPICAFDVGGVGELIKHEQTGLLSPARDVAAMAENVRILIENPLMASQLVARAQRKIRNMFDPPNAGAMLLDCLRVSV